MKLLKSNNEFELNLDGLNGRLITINNEYLFLLNYKIETRNIKYLTVDSGYILSFLRIFYSKELKLLTGFDLFMSAINHSNRQIIVIGKRLKNETAFLNENPKVKKINAIYGSAEEINSQIKIDYPEVDFDNCIVLIMLGAEKQEKLGEIIEKSLIKNNTLIAGLGGTWEQIVDNKKVPDFFLYFRLSWLYRTVMFWDKSKPKKILRSIYAFSLYWKLLKWIK